MSDEYIEACASLAKAFVDFVKIDGIGFVVPVDAVGAFDQLQAAVEHMQAVISEEAAP